MSADKRIDRLENALNKLADSKGHLFIQGIDLKKALEEAGKNGL